MVPRLLTRGAVRVVLALLAVIALGGWVGIRQLPDGESAAPASVRRQEVASVSLDGTRLPLAALREILTTRAGDLIDLDAIARDRLALTQALVARGYLRARVGEPRVTFDAAGAAYITFAIEQGALFRIGRVDVTGAEPGAAGVVTIGEGDLADSHHIALAQRALEERLRVRSRAVAKRVRTELAIDDARGVADLRLVADRR